jgi:hypothetical protein
MSTRTQYPFAALSDAQLKALVGVNRPLVHRIMIQTQWDTFERVENYNDVIYQQYLAGERSNMYYQFKNDQEFKDYKVGQQLHVNAYPNLPVGTFQPVTDRPIPPAPPNATIPYETNVPRFIINRITPTASEQAQVQSDLALYAYVSTFNAAHVLKYQFVDDVEKNAFERAELRVNALVSTSNITFL